MGIRTETVIHVTCDHCGLELDDSESYVDATVYGVAFHASCWELIGGPRVARVLYLDDIHYSDGSRAMEPFQDGEGRVT